MCLLPFWWLYLEGPVNAGSRNGLKWTIFGLSDTRFPFGTRIARKRQAAASRPVYSDTTQLNSTQLDVELS